MFQYVIIGFTIGFIFFNCMNPGKEKQKPLIFNSVIVKIMSNTYHIHHWIIFLLIFLLFIPIIVIYGYSNISGLILGICIGSILQGLTYKDAFVIKIKCTETINNSILFNIKCINII